MSDSAFFRLQAEKCLRLAGENARSHLGETLTKMASSYLAKAEELDRGVIASDPDLAWRLHQRPQPHPDIPK
jgi:hypothetical protein